MIDFLTLPTPLASLSQVEAQATWWSLLPLNHYHIKPTFLVPSFLEVPLALKLTWGRPWWGCSAHFTYNNSPKEGTPCPGACLPFALPLDLNSIREKTTPRGSKHIISLPPRDNRVVLPGSSPLTVRSGHPRLEPLRVPRYPRYPPPPTPFAKLTGLCIF